MKLSVKQQKQLVENLAKLPEKCAQVSPSDPFKVVIIKKGIDGYFPAPNLKSAEDAEAYNEKLGVTPIEANAMLVGSMFGWHVPGANPENEIYKLKERN